LAPWADVHNADNTNGPADSDVTTATVGTDNATTTNGPTGLWRGAENAESLGAENSESLDANSESLGTTFKPNRMMNLLKDRLGKHRWWNAPLRNPTQTAIRRFLNSPQIPLASDFTKSIESWNQHKNDFLNKLNNGDLS